MAEIIGRKIALIGAMGSGKSTLALAYAARFGGTVCDTDELFSRRYGEINAYFEAHGERAFRIAEDELLAEAAQSEATVIACGGGAVLNKRGMNALRAHCDIVYLTAPENILIERIAPSARPLKDRAQRLIVERAPLYKRYADYTVDTDNSVDGTVEALAASLRSPRPNRYDVVLCDADDTVLDYQAAMTHSLTVAARAAGIKSSDDVLFAKYKIVSDEIWGRLEKGEITHAQLNDLRFKLLSDLLHEKIDAPKMNDIYFAEMKKTRYTVDGAKEFLAELRNRGVKTYIATNAFESIARERLKAVDGLTDGAFISETVGFDKPNTKYFEHIHAAIGEPNKDRILMFGDGVTSDIAGGKAFGIDTCLFDRRGNKTSDADFTVRSFAELLDIL